MMQFKLQLILKPNLSQFSLLNVISIQTFIFIFSLVPFLYISEEKIFQVLYTNKEKENCIGLLLVLYFHGK